mmetsp:Transcript_18281/g.39351  ORF Transcript_18281/g.39351 Transcript_18281/m.39351 type:complete len:141 (+) Transcript_18281:166-588(+)|eukprot:CAMPEP_0202893592 /NCGR_PEP_ID=MMETSP1392-20130828/3150_1 /ASSEMBLY_ACC=CAM_ASM_000868 /TAXON_ID=225041 /ORGANISM="Chlamydomonas chlamydogama, Strain SAG 11-48b" /LENGTH=140 /DNA_ID=CAMNT_0049577979 /DNA_START=165 /DNA_END=587 /DNA_ORIENTATION=-
MNFLHHEAPLTKEQVLEQLHVRVTKVKELSHASEELRNLAHEAKERLEQLKASVQDLPSLADANVRAAETGRDATQCQHDLHHAIKDLKHFLEHHEGEVQGTDDWRDAHELVKGSEGVLEAITHFLGRLFGIHKEEAHTA